VLPLVVRVFQVMGGPPRARWLTTKSKNKSKVRVETWFLHFFVDDTTGAMRRKVLKGVDANAHLSELSTER
jgi:hypothetical protein